MLLEGVPASLGPGLRTVSGARRTYGRILPASPNVCKNGIAADPARARISTVRHSDPAPVYLRAAAGTSPVVAAGKPPAATPPRLSSAVRPPSVRLPRVSTDFPPPVVSEVEPPSACGERSRTALRPPPVVSEVEPPFFAVHQWINAFQPNNSPTFSKLFQRPRPWQAGQARSASRSVVTISDLDPASDPGRRASLEGYPPKTPSDFRRCSLFPRCSMSQEEVTRNP